jgi:hypothetical protein
MSKLATDHTLPCMIDDSEFPSWKPSRLLSLTAEAVNPTDNHGSI